MNSEIAKLVQALQREDDQQSAVNAVETLLASPASLAGPPPPELIRALLEGGTTLDASFLNLARAWSRPEMSRAVLNALSAAQAADEKEEAAWLLKTVLAFEHSHEVIGLIREQRETPQVRRWLLEALERLTRAGTLGWDQLGPVVMMVAEEQNSVLRAGLPAFLDALPWRAENVGLLETLLRDDDYEVVSAAAATLARHPDAARGLQAKTLERLREHPNAMMKHSAALLDQSIRGARES